MIVHLNEQGEITFTLHDPTGDRLYSISEVEESRGVLYIGSYHLPFLSKLYISDFKGKVP